MFSNLGLLSSERCPDPSCRRPKCFFSHGETSSSAQRASNSTSAVNNGAIKPTAASPAKRKVSDVNSKLDAERISSAKRAATAGNQVDPVKQTTSLSRVEVKPATTILKPATPAPPPVRQGQPPMLPVQTRPSPQPRTDRQKGLSSLYTQFVKLYAPILTQSPELAHQSSLAQESEISSSSTTLRTYKTAIHHAAVSISRRIPPDTIPHPSIGTVKESRIAHEAAEKEKAGRLTRATVEKYCLPLDEFKTWRYPDPRDESLTGPETGNEPDGEGTTQNCNRCKVQFVVSSSNLSERFGECKYHYGKTAPERVEGRRKWVYSCCGKERGEQGCEDGIHVFSDGEEDKKLASRVGYKTVKQCVEEQGLGDGGVEVVGMDCEMICTTAGISLGRVTIVDEKGETLLDELIRQKVPILDVNTRFSGISPGQLDSAIMDLPAVRAAACMFIGKDTIIVGHGLENDLRALRLLHDRIIDTAVVFPHDKGPPYRRALRDIVKEKLGYFIQDRTSDLGHSSAVDAKATLDALRWKVRDDKV